MDSCDLLHWNREEAERVGVTKILLRREGKTREIFNRTQIIGTDARLVELGTIGGVVLIGVCYGPGQPLQLQVLQLSRGKALVRVQLEGRLPAHRIVS